MPGWERGKAEGRSEKAGSRRQEAEGRKQKAGGKRRKKDLCFGNKAGMNLVYPVILSETTRRGLEQGFPVLVRSSILRVQYATIRMRTWREYNWVRPGERRDIH